MEAFEDDVGSFRVVDVRYGVAVFGDPVHDGGFAGGVAAFGAAQAAQDAGVVEGVDVGFAAGGDQARGRHVKEFRH